MVVLTSFAPPNEGVRLQQQNTSAHVQGKDMGKGTLFIAERYLFVLFTATVSHEQIHYKESLKI